MGEYKINPNKNGLEIVKTRYNKRGEVAADDEQVFAISEEVSDGRQIHGTYYVMAGGVDGLCDVTTTLDAEILRGSWRLLKAPRETFTHYLSFLQTGRKGYLSLAQKGFYNG